MRKTTGKKIYLAGAGAGAVVPSLRVYKPATAPAIVYYIRLDFKDGLALYKIGYTSMTIAKRVEGYYDRRTRCYKGGMGLPCGCTYRIIATLYKGSKKMAYEEEQRLHSLYQLYSWKGSNRCRNGNTELYIKDVLGLDKPV